MASGSPASSRWGRKEFGWSQRPGQDTQVVGGYVFRLHRSFVHTADYGANDAAPAEFPPPMQGFLRGYRVRTASTSASATSARGRTPDSRMNSCGACAPPPRGPGPSAVSGTDGAKWLGSLAPPPRAPTIGRPIAALARSRRPPVASRESIPGHSRMSVASSRAPPISAGTAPTTARRASSVSARTSATSSPLSGTTLNASPDRMTVGTTVRRSAPSGSCRPASAWAAPASAGRALMPRCGAEPECAERPCAVTWTVAAALRLTITRSRPAVAARRRDGRARLDLDDPPLAAVVGAPAALEAQARVVPREALDVRERADPPLLVAHAQQRGLGDVLAPVGERAQDSERDDVAALHVDRSGADEPVFLAPQRPVVPVRDDGVDVAEQQHPLRSRAAETDEQIRRVVGRRARDALDLRLVRRERGGDRGGLLGAGDVAAGRGDGDQRLELARGARGDRVGVGLDPVVHRPWRRAPRSTISTTSSGSSVQRMSSRSPGEIIASAAARSRIHPIKPDHHSVPTSTTGNSRILCVWTSTSASNSSSSVPNPPGKTTNAVA